MYRYFGLQTQLNHLVKVIPQLKNGGTHGVILGQHALRHGFNVELITYNLYMFDPTWFQNPKVNLIDKLQQQMQVKTRAGFQRASRHYLEFLKLGGRISMRELNADLIRHYLKQHLPILTGLNSTYLYQEKRFIAETDVTDEFAGTPEGHFVVICGSHPNKKPCASPTPIIPTPSAKTPFMMCLSTASSTPSSSALSLTMPTSSSYAPKTRKPNPRPPL